MVDRLNHVRPTHPLWEGLKEISFTMRVRNKLMRGVPVSMKNCGIALLCGSELIAETAATELGILKYSAGHWKLGSYYRETYFFFFNGISIC